MPLVRQQQRRDTSANWALYNPVLLDGELGVDTSVDRIKVGDGVTAWSGLPFADKAEQVSADAARAETAADQAVAVSTSGLDPANAVLIQAPDSATAAALAASTAVVVGPPAQLATMGAADAARSLAASQAKYADAGAIDQPWASTTGWQNDGALTFGGGHLYGRAVAASAVLSKSLLNLSGASRTQATLTHVTGGAARNTLFGFSSLTADTTHPNDLNDFTGVGLFDNGGSAWLIAYDRGTPVVGVTAGPQFNGTATYIVTLTTDADWISATIATIDGPTEWGVRIDRNTYNPKQLMWWSSDPREATGDYLGRVTGRAEIVTHPARVYEATSPGAHRVVLAGQDAHIATPVGYDSRVPAPLVLYFHGFGGNQLAVLKNGASSNVFNVYKALLDAGFIVASTLAHGGDEVGTGFDDYATLYRYVRDHYATGPVLLMAESFGNVSAARILAGQTVPNIAAFVSFYGVLDLAVVYAASRAGDNVLADAIDAKYGSLAAAQTAGADPMLYATNRYRGVPFLGYHSAGDTTVPKAATDNFAAKLAAAGTYAPVITTTGNHGDPSNFADPGQVVGFFNAALGRV